jgi:hypothetical protein
MLYSRIRITNCGTETLTQIGIRNECGGNGACDCDLVPLPIITHDLAPGESQEYLISKCTNPAFATPGISPDCVCTTTVTAVGLMSGIPISDDPVIALVDVLVPSPPIATLKSVGDGQDVLLEGKLVTAGNATFPGFFYLEDENRASGIRVVATTPVWTNDIVHVSGTLDTNEDGERCILADAIGKADCPGNAPLPLGMRCCDVGGGALGLWAGGVKGGFGTNNVGLLIRVWGRVVAIGAGCFYLQDGSNMADGPSGLKVVGAVPVPAGTDPIGRYVAVTGISSCYKFGGDIYRLVRATSVQLREH